MIRPVAVASGKAGHDRLRPSGRGDTRPSVRDNNSLDLAGADEECRDEVIGAMLIATHEMGFACDIASRVCFLADGEIVEQAPPGRLFSEPSDERTRRFLRRIVDAGRM